MLTTERELPMQTKGITSSIPVTRFYWRKSHLTTADPSDVAKIVSEILQQRKLWWYPKGCFFSPLIVTSAFAIFPIWVSKMEFIQLQYWFMFSINQYIYCVAAGVVPVISPNPALHPLLVHRSASMAHADDVTVRVFSLNCWSVTDWDLHRHSIHVHLSMPIWIKHH